MKTHDPNSSSDPKEPAVSLHAEVVKGIVRVILFLAQSQGHPVNFGDLIRAGQGTDGYKHPDADGYVLEFIKDGVVNLQQKHIDRVLAGDYSDTWATTNRYLKFYGIAPVEPHPLTL